ncbi:phage holin [Bacillus sp. JJ722]|uniref:phage holin n=1 Tax=Bacillus sp. JJ722 TaxID=3122973 RepID=UPI002FFF6593
MINWKVRFKNPTWIVTVGIPSLIILAQIILAFVNEFITPTGFSITDDAINGFMGIVNFIAITFLGIGGVVDPTTKGVADSDAAKNYNDPN